MNWYRDAGLIQRLPRRYRWYARYSRMMGRDDSRSVKGGSFLLREIRRLSDLFHVSTIAPIQGIDDLVVLADFGDGRILEVIHEIRGEQPEYAMMKSVITAGDTFIDVGANFGTFSLLASKIVGPPGRVVAIEPQSRLVKLLESSIRMSHVSNCRVMQLACGSRSQSLQLLIPHNDTGRAGFFSGFSGRTRHDTEDVRVIALDDLLDSLSTSTGVLLKIDVEGSEFDVLAGAQRLIAVRRPSIMIELNPFSASSAGRRPVDLLDVLTALGYRRFVTSQSFPATIDLSNIDLSKQTNVLATM